MRIHVLGLPHTQTTEGFTSCAFTQKALNLCKMLHRRGHDVVHYGVEGSNPECTKHVTVMPEATWKKAIGGHPGKSFYNIGMDGPVLAPYHALFGKNLQAALRENVGPRYTEIVCQTWGGSQLTGCQGIEQYMVESGIGYPNSWADWRVYESYAWLHMHLGRDKLFGGRMWYWAVIPNAFPVENFTPNQNGQRGEDFLYLGRLNEDKGVGIAIDVAKEIGRKIVICGQGNPEPFLRGNPHARYMAPVGVEERRKLLANARAVFCLTQFVEPFCGVNVEAQLSGTPVIASDFGVFPETVIHGVTGYRGRTIEQWVWAAKNIDRIDGRVCAQWAHDNYSLERVALMYEEFFQQILNVRDSNGRKIVGPTGFYERHPGRTQLDWLVKQYPQAAADARIDLTRPHEAPEPPQPENAHTNGAADRAIVQKPVAKAIPRIIHHIWIGSPFPTKFHEFRHSWTRHHPDWTSVFWRGDDHILDERVAQIVASQQYTAVVKSDILRLYALKTMGGLYVDTDFECLKPFDALLSTGGFHCGYQGAHDSVAALASGLMACPPNDPLVVRYLDEALEQLSALGPDVANREPNKVTGPWLLTKLSATASITRHPRELFYPVLIDPPPPEAYARHHWAGSAPDGWLGQQQNNAAPAEVLPSSEPPLISFVMRVHNEAETLRESITSLFAIAVPIEIVVVLHRCTDASKNIAFECRAAAPPRHTVRVVQYNLPVSRAGLETFITPSDSPHSFVSYSKLAFDLARCAWKVKWDADFIATDSFVRWIDGGDWSRTTPTVVNLCARFSDGQLTVEPYMHNCLLGFAKGNFWEVPRFPDEFVREDAPEQAAFIHRANVSDVKSYWRQPPWFASDETPEAEELRRLYNLAVERVGPEPVACARSCNPEAEAYLARCLAIESLT